MPRRNHRNPKVKHQWKPRKSLDSARQRRRRADRIMAARRAQSALQRRRLPPSLGEGEIQ